MMIVMMIILIFFILVMDMTDQLSSIRHTFELPCLMHFINVNRSKFNFPQIDIEVNMQIRRILDLFRVNLKIQRLDLTQTKKLSWWNQSKNFVMSDFATSVSIFC